MTTESNLERMIRLGEDSRLELKSLLLQGSRVIGPRRTKMADVVAGMANSHGGTIVLGVDDKTRDVSGIPLDQLDDGDMPRFGPTAYQRGYSST